MIYNQQRHIQLLKRSQDFKDQGKSFYKESPEESLELFSYNVAVEENIFWQQSYYCPNYSNSNRFTDFTRIFVVNYKTN